MRDPITEYAQHVIFEWEQDAEGVDEVASVLWNRLYPEDDYYGIYENPDTWNESGHEARQKFCMEVTEQIVREMARLLVWPFDNPIPERT